MLEINSIKNSSPQYTENFWKSSYSYAMNSALYRDTRHDVVPPPGGNFSAKAVNVMRNETDPLQNSDPIVF
jgi:hypothetical protein